MESIRFINLEYFFNRITEFFTESTLSTGVAGGLFGKISLFFTTLIRFILPILIVVLIGLYFYYRFKALDMRYLERNRTYERISRTRQEHSQASHSTKWDRVVELFSSETSSDWRVGIIEADAMLDSLVTSLGYSGATLGEKLKNIDKGHFPTLQDAWDAHTIRNRIAHDGVDFQLDEITKNRVFKLYEKVFLDAGYI